AVLGASPDRERGVGARGPDRRPGPPAGDGGRGSAAQVIPSPRAIVAAGVITLALSVAAAVPWMATAALALDVAPLLAVLVDARRAARVRVGATRPWPPLLVQAA